MGQALPEILTRGAARQVYRLLRLSAPLLRPIYQRIGLESRARAVTALVRFGWNGAAVTPPLAKQSEIVAPERLSAGRRLHRPSNRRVRRRRSASWHGAGA